MPENVLKILIVAAGGGVGSAARYVVTGWSQRWFPPGGFPMGTFVVNSVGCLLIGAFMTLIVDRLLPEYVRLLLVTGFLGGLTTFSTFGYETVELARESNLRMATLNLVASLVVGLGAVWLGRVLSKLLGA